MKKQLFIGHLMTLMLGGLIYLFFRVKTLLVFEWFESLNIIEFLRPIRIVTMGYSVYLPDWLLFSLPDGLWIFSYMAIILLIWRNRIKKNNVIWIFIVPLLIILIEIGQLYHVIIGTFDSVDLIFYFFGAILPILIFTDILTIVKKEL